MKNFLFFDNETGEHFFVSARTSAIAIREAECIVENPEALEYFGAFSDVKAECMGYDTY